MSPLVVTEGSQLKVIVFYAYKSAYQRNAFLNCVIFFLFFILFDFIWLKVAPPPTARDRGNQLWKSMFFMLVRSPGEFFYEHCIVYFCCCFCLFFFWLWRSLFSFVADPFLFLFCFFLAVSRVGNLPVITITINPKHDEQKYWLKINMTMKVKIEWKLP